MLDNTQLMMNEGIESIVKEFFFSNISLLGENHLEFHLKLKMHSLHSSSYAHCSSQTPK